MNYKITVAYDGTKYDGWQRQGNTDKTIQGKLEQILKRMMEEEIEVHGSGRTDAGVHAECQVANFHLKRAKKPEELKELMNHYLPEDIAVLGCEEASERFHSRLSAVKKTYRYQLEMGPKRDVFQKNYYYGLGKTLDIGQMKAAAGYLTGTHDFKSFCGNRKMKKSTVRTIESIEFTQPDSGKLHIRFTGNGFLQQMVRILTGTLIEVGLGTKKAEEIPALLEAKDRQAAGFTAPAQGLFLEKVEYGEDK